MPSSALDERTATGFGVERSAHFLPDLGGPVAQAVDTVTGIRVDTRTNGVEGVLPLLGAGGIVEPRCFARSGAA